MAQGKRTVSDEEILREMREDSDAAFIASGLADRFEDIKTEAMRGRLDTLAEKGDVHKKKAGSRTAIYWADCDHGQSTCLA